MRVPSPEISQSSHVVFVAFHLTSAIPSMNPSPLLLQRRASGFTLMELLVTIGIILILVAITLPIVSLVQHHAGKAQALNVMRQLGGAAGNHAVANGNTLPAIRN